MKAVVNTAAGNPEVLRLDERDKPVIQRDDQLLVRLHAAGVNPIDGKIRLNPEKFSLTPPFIPGCDGAGEVDAVGAAVSRFIPGDAVYFCQPPFNGRQGCYAQYALVDQCFVAPKPRDMSFIEAAAVPLVLITAWEALHDRVQICVGQRVLIQAGAGGVGHIAVQLAKQAGAAVCTTVSTEEKADFARKLGADHCIFYRREKVAEAVLAWSGGESVDVAFDTVGGECFQQCLDATRCYGDVVTILQPPGDQNWSGARLKNLRISQELMLTPTLLEMAEAKNHQGGILRHCSPWFDDGRLRIAVARTFPLAQAAEAQRCLEQEAPIGKVVLTID